MVDDHEQKILWNNTAGAENNALRDLCKSGGISSRRSEESRDAVRTEPFPHFHSLRLLVQPMITAPRTDDDTDYLRIVFGQERRQRDLLAMRHRITYPQRDWLLGKGLSKEQQQQTENQ